MPEQTFVDFFELIRAILHRSTKSISCAIDSLQIIPFLLLLVCFASPEVSTAATLEAGHIEKLVRRGAFGQELLPFISTDGALDISELSLPRRGIQLFRWNSGEMSHFLIVDHGKCHRFYSHLGISEGWNAELLQSGKHLAVRLLLPNPLGLPEPPAQTYLSDEKSIFEEYGTATGSPVELLFTKVSES